MVPNGYNLRLGGNSGRHHAETKQKISDTLKKNFANGLVHSRHQLGRPHDEATKQKISESLKGHKFSQETINKRILSRRIYNIIQLDIHGNRLNSFDSCKEAAEYIGISLNSINLCCIGKAKTAKGYVWKYEPIIK